MRYVYLKCRELLEPSWSYSVLTMGKVIQRIIWHIPGKYYQHLYKGGLDLNVWKFKGQRSCICPLTPPTKCRYMWHIRWKYISRAIHWYEFHCIKTFLVQDMTLLVTPVVPKWPKNDENCTYLVNPWPSQDQTFSMLRRSSKKLFVQNKKKSEMPFFYN